MRRQTGRGWMQEAQRETVCWAREEDRWHEWEVRPESKVQPYQKVFG